MFSLKWNFDDYTPAELKKKDTKELHDEFSRMRDVLQKRYKRMLKSEFKDSPAAKAYKLYGIPKISEISDDITLRRVMSSMATQIKNGSSSIAVQRKKDKALQDAIKHGLGDLFDDLEDIDDLLANGADTYYQMTFKERGEMWAWIRAKYDESFFPASSSMDNQVTEVFKHTNKSNVRKMLFGGWMARQQNKSARYIRTGGKAQTND